VSKKMNEEALAENMTVVARAEGVGTFRQNLGV
jgi:hypothetical protein